MDWFLHVNLVYSVFDFHPGIFIYIYIYIYIYIIYIYICKKIYYYIYIYILTSIPLDLRWQG